MANLRKFKLELGNVEELSRFLSSLQEMGGDPRRFISFTREYDSLSDAFNSIKNKVIRETRKLMEIQRKNKSTKATLENIQKSLREDESVISRLEKTKQQLIVDSNFLGQQKYRLVTELGDLEKRIDEAQRVLDVIIQRIATWLGKDEGEIQNLLMQEKLNIREEAILKGINEMLKRRQLERT